VGSLVIVALEFRQSNRHLVRACIERTIGGKLMKVSEIKIRNVLYPDVPTSCLSNACDWVGLRRRPGSLLIAGLDLSLSTNSY
jgi:hypothetical protein